MPAGGLVKIRYRYNLPGLSKKRCNRAFCVKISGGPIVPAFTGPCTVLTERKVYWVKDKTLLSGASPAGRAC